MKKKFLQLAKNIKVLYVEDHRESAKSTVELFNNFFYSVTHALNGMEALELFKKSSYDLIVTDINMPKLDGIGLTKEIKNIDNQIPIIVISAHNETNYFVELITLGVDGFLIKPLQSTQFITSLFKVLTIIDDRNTKIEHENLKQKYQDELEKKVNEQIDLLRTQDKILQQQSKMAAMGEMIDAVAHQWKQPINIIKMNVDMIGYDYEDGFVKDNYISDFQNRLNKQINHMTNTLDEFRTFFRPNKEVSKFNLKDTLNSVLLLTKDDLVKTQIEVMIEDDGNCYIDAIENEIKHLLLNLISNAKDAFVENNIKNKTIKFNLFNKNNTSFIEIIDNAGGIPQNIIDNIFKANFTTKDETKGSGIGLYMSMQIALKYHGILKVENTKDGAKFIFSQNLIYNDKNVIK